jgi:hypothetical protein
MGCADNITEGADPLSSDKIVSKTEDTTSPQKIRDENNSTSRSDVIARSAESHSHGKAELAVVFEAGKVTIEFQTPLYNVLGFEQIPNTEAQKDRVSHAETILGQAPKLFTFNDKAACDLTSRAEEIVLFPPEHDNHNSHNHDDEHKHDDKKDNQPATEHNHATAHKDLQLTYEFSCRKPEALSSISVNMFEFFEKLLELDAVYLGPSTQKQVTLTRNNAQLDISQ